jgi:GNAT superfamily N-acetyltransferase
VDELHIEQIRPELTWRLRREVLYPAEPLSAMKMDEDTYGVHFGGFYSNQLVCIVSLFNKGTDFQFRKFAVLPIMQGKGVGKKLLQYITDFARNQGGERIWCNARSTAVKFYQKAGFITTGQTFSKNGFDYEIYEKTLNGVPTTPDTSY